MVLQMASPFKHPRTGVYWARYVVPKALRPLVGKSERQRTLGTKDPATAKTLFPGVLAALQAEVRLAADRAAGKTVSLTASQVAEMVGAYYRDNAALADADPGTAADADEWMGLLLDASTEPTDDETAAAERVFRATGDDLERARVFLEGRGIVADTETTQRAAEALFWARYRLQQRRLQRARQDFGPDPNEARYPQPGSAASALTFTALLEAHQAERQEQPKTFDRRRHALRRLREVVGHDDAHRIDKAAVRTLKEKRAAGGASNPTIAADIAMLRGLWTWGAANGLISETRPNPFSGMTPKGSKKRTTERQPFSEDEARAMLEAARAERGWLRWLPWVLAFTGCRLEEVCGAMRADVRQVQGVWVLDIHDRSPGRTLKDGQPVRMVPLHPALIEEGFLGYVTALGDADHLFPDLQPGRFGKRSEMATKKLGRWMRSRIGITDPAKVAGHSWRHRMKDLLRFSGAPAEAADAFLGHTNAVNAGSGYGMGWRGRPDALLKFIAKLPTPWA